MSISAFSRRSLLSVKALRLYDEMGLLRPERIDPSSGYRYYRESQLATARQISLLRRLDVPLAQIGNMVQKPDSASQLLMTWWESEESAFNARRDLLRFVRETVLGEDLKDGGYDIGVRDVGSSTFLYRSHNVHGPELPSFIGTASEELNALANAYGGSIGFPTVVFHGVVDFDSDGPAEVRVPIAAGARAKNGDSLGSEASHTQVFVALRKHQVAFPQILQVYRALRRWIAANNYTITGPPRELYLEDFDNARHNELICEIAFPVQKT